MHLRNLPSRGLPLSTFWSALVGVALLSATLTASAQWMLSGNENKIDLSSGTPTVVADAPPDTLSLLDFSVFPPAVRHLPDVSNSVIGPPSNLAITPDHKLALIADSVVIDPDDPTQYVPATGVHVLDLTLDPPRVIGRVEVGQQPSGMSIAPDGRMALVANRADGTVSVLSIDGKTVRVTQTLEVCAPEDSASDVAIDPNGRQALVSVQEGGYLQLLRIDSGGVVVTDRKFSVYGRPYRCVISPRDGLGLTAGQGAGNGLDADALSVIDLQTNPPRTVDYVTLGAVPESIEISPDGKLVVAVIMTGSNLAPTDPNFRPNGALVVLARKGRTFEKVQELPVGRIPEGVAFSSDGRYVVVQCHPDRELQVFRVRGKRVKDTGLRIPVPGMPSSLRAAP